LPWTEVVFLQSSGAAAYQSGGQVTINLSDITVPFSTSATHQPYGFDQLAAFYRRFKVHECDVTITMSAGGVGTTAVNAMRGYVQWQPPSWNYSMANVAGAASVLSERQSIDSYPLLSNTAKGVVTIRKRISIARLAGLSDGEFEANANEYAGGFPATAPSRVCSVGLAVSSDTIVAAGVSCIVQLVFHGEAFERIDYVSS
jgi:hypothetical protein